MSSSLQAASPSASLSHPAVHEKKASGGIKTVRARAPKSRFNTWPSRLIHCLASILPPYPPHTHTFTSFPPPIVSVSGCKWWELGAITYSKWEVITVRTDRWRRRHVEVWMEEGKEGFIFKPGDDRKKKKTSRQLDQTARSCSSSNTCLLSWPSPATHLSGGENCVDKERSFHILFLVFVIECHALYIFC